MKGLGDMMKQAKQMQEQLQKAQEEFAKKAVVGSSGAGLVEVHMNGSKDVSRVQIDDSLMSEDKEVLEDLLAAAVNDAVRKIEQEQQSLFSDMAGGMSMPPGFKMPF